ncbi:hypothetical protein B0A55_05644 [Friedmanniomyces simplex]|uniref:Aminotransferase class I/classII large domain-containing protein n=1 Tax=Friedmanniomyces simplex TaxID=329884 RepID=A0A4U0XEH0_9PEZI|nr:hypothetical protein B0A55_05644 [Friedmanniomyces simplex]
MIIGGSFNYAGTYGMSADYDALHRECLNTLPIPGAASSLVERALQEAVAGFWSADCCFTTPTGYQSNILAFTAILDNDWVVLMDQKSHSSMSTAVYLANAGGRKKFKHNDMRDLERLLEEVHGRYANVIVAVEGLYSLDGDVPDLATLHTLKARYDFVLCCDEAHSFMLLGKTGRGCLEWWNDTHPDNTVPVDLIDIRTTTLSKAVGGLGGLKEKNYITLILNAQPTDSTAEVNPINLIERLLSLRRHLKGLTILLDSTPTLHNQNAISTSSTTTLHLLAAKLPARLLVFGSFYQSLGLNGAYLAGDKALVDELRYTGRGYVFTAAPAPYVMGMVAEALGRGCGRDGGGGMVGHG